MRRTTVMLPDELAQLVEFETQRSGSSTADLVRRALEAYLADQYQKPRRLAIVGIGPGTSTEHDLSERVDEVLAEGWTREEIAGSDS